MIDITGVEQKAAWDANVLPPVERVRPGLWSIPVPIPDNPLRYVNVYTLELDDGVAIVDAGWNHDAAWDALVAGLDELGGSVSDVQAVLVTHFHADHYGLAGRVREASGAWIGLHPEDAVMLQARHVDAEAVLAAICELLAESGVPEEKFPNLDLAAGMMRMNASMAEPDVFFEDGRTIELPGWNLRTIWTPGHSPGHVCFHDAERSLFLSGDHILPRITPNVAVHSRQHDNPLGDFLSSLLKVRDVEADEVLPAHEYRFAGLDRRVDELIAHHADRLDEIEAAVLAAPGQTAWDLTVNLTWSRPWDDIPDFMQRVANGETLAHLVVLENHDRVERRGTTPARFFPGAAAGTGDDVRRRIAILRDPPQAT